jgi:HTH-type transcriptional regulator/antitoxin HipB
LLDRKVHDRVLFALLSIDDFDRMSSIVYQTALAAMRIRTVKDIGLIIRDRRREFRMGQRALADKVGVSRQWIVQVERGKPRAAANLLLRALAALDLEIAIDQTKSSRAKPAASPEERGNRHDRERRGNDGGRYDVDIDAVIERARGKRQ